MTHLKLRLLTTVAAGWLAACGAQDPADPPAATQTAPQTAPQAAQTAQAGPFDFVQDISDLPMDEDILYGKLDNGLRYAVMSNDTPSQTATLLMRVDAGSFDETDETRGIAHFLEHMAFNGSENVPEGEMIKRLERLGLAFGPDTNASTGFDQTVYQLELPDVSDELIGEALGIFRETAERLTLAPDAIDRERGVILAEKRARNSPAYRSQIAALEFQTEGLELGQQLPIGTVETIQSVTPEQFRHFYETQYRPEDTFVVLVGDRSKEELAAAIETAFADWANDAEPVGDTDLPEIGFDEPRFGAFFDPEIVSQITLSTIGEIAPEEERRDTAANRAADMPLYLANAILNRRFARKVRAGEASYTGAGVGVSDLFDSAEIASLRVSAEPDRLRDGFIEAERILRQAIDHGFTQAELDEQIANARKSWEVAVQTAPTRRTPSLAQRIVNSFASERVVTSAESSLERFDATIGDVDLAAVEAALRDAWERLDTAPQLYLQSDEAVEDPEGWLQSLLDEARSVSLPADVRKDAGAFAYVDWGEAGTVAERGEIADIGIQTVVFDNGVRLNMKPTDYEQDVVRIRVRAGSGGAFYPQDRPAFGMQLRSVLGASAVGAHAADDLATLTAGRTVGVSRSFGTRDMILSGATVPGDLDLQMQLMAAYLADPAYRPETLANFESQIRSVWSKLDSTPRGAAGIAVPSILSSGHWRDVHPSEAQALDVDLDALADWYDANIEGGPIEIGVVGDFDVDAMTDLVARTFGTLPERAAASPALPASALDRVFPDGRAAPHLIAHAGEPDTARVSVYWPVADHEDTLTDRRLRALSDVLQLELNEVLREEEGATYSPSAFASLPDTDPDWGYIAVTIEAEPDEAARLTGVIETVAADLVTNGVEADTFDRAMKPTLEGIETSLENNDYWLGVIDEAQTRPETLDRHRTREAAYADMTAEDLSGLAEQILSPDRAVRVHVLPEG
ncbi:M16 family metallopeptidase [uncultured Algimonas sp.]|uniref:M16 family metallopeptidase n=1 Tax=uncultured Algimonas sp. TaxID=1547920 RepID=UPI002638BF5A|nr:M16 family metallopeptidase [uncultured Algimonas sp.]